MEIIITQTAKTEFDKMLKGSEYKNIRILTKRESIYENARLDFELDEKKQDDLLYNVDGYNIIMNVKLAAQLYNLTISYGGLLSRDKFCIETDFGMI
ncbi:MAG: hypothetical protein ACRC3Y_11565 [Romboutsia sp.]|uniref:hypothetical protein n=1 Tax=Romboutsia sp. TaxID=1965302 RepID=UPI003F2C9E77